MAIELMFDETVEVQRLTQVGATNKKDYQTHIENLRVHIQPFSEDITQDAPGAFGKDWLMFGELADIDEGDHIIRSDARVYRVVGVERFDMGVENHVEARIRIFES